MKTILALFVVCLLAGCVADGTAGYVVCTDRGGVSTKSSHAAEWLFIDGQWRGYSTIGEARAFPSATITPTWGSECHFVEDQQ